MEELVERLNLIESSKDGIKLIRKCPFELVIDDIQRPTGTGQNEK